MKKLLLACCLLLTATVVMAGSPPQADPVQPPRTSCNMPSVAHDWDFTASDQGFATTTCDAGGAPVWAWGNSTIPGAPGTVWGTVLTGNYPNDAGEGLVSPSFTVGNDSYLLELGHYFDCEANFDGMNVKVGGTVITPDGGYTGTISTSTSYYAWCVDMEQGWTGHDATWRADCFDLSAYMGQTISVEFDFGSDSSVSYPGWYLAYVRVGGEGGGTPAEAASWGSIKSLYK